MVEDARLKRYDTVSEAVEASSWIIKSRPYLDFKKHPFFDTFRDYLDWMRIIFDERFIADGRELDAGDLGRDPLSNERYRILHVHGNRWATRDRLSNVALMVHELLEGYLLACQLTFFSEASHIVAEFFEGDFRLEHGLPECTECPLPQGLLHPMRQFEQDLEKKIAIMEPFGVERLMRERYPLLIQYAFDPIRMRATLSRQTP